MPQITFFRQQRLDGGIRTGIDVDRETLLEHFQSGGDDSDPALAWFVDVRSQADSLPWMADDARKWLLSQEAIVSQAFRDLEQEFRAGWDRQEWPFQWPIAAAPPGVDMKIVGSCVRRWEAADLGQIFADIGRHWREYVELPLSPEFASNIQH